MNAVTKALHYTIDGEGAAPTVTPIYQSSAFDAGSPFFYTRKSNPNTAELEGVVACLEGARHGVAVSTGMAAIRTCLELATPGDTVVINRLMYGCSIKLVQRYCARFGLHLRVLDLTTTAGVEAIPEDVRLVLFETPTNPFLKPIDISRVAAAAKTRSRRALIIVDNTWATPLYQKPLRHGADISLHSATKYMSGHSDVMGGIILTDDDALADFARQERFYSGAVLDPHAAWLLRRSLQTLSVRLQKQSQTTLEMRHALEKMPHIERVYYPQVDGRQLVKYGGILFVEISPAAMRSYAQLLKQLSWFGNGTGMACVTSMIAQPYTGSHASLTPEEKAEIGLSPNLVRFCFGLEEVEDLKADLTRALGRIAVEAEHV